MQDKPKSKFPAGGLLASMLGPEAPVDVRRAAQRLRAEGAPAVAVEADIAALARGLAESAVSRSAALLDVLPPLFWIEGEEDAAGGVVGWVVETKPDGLAARGFRVSADTTAVPEPAGTTAVRFGTVTSEDAGAQRVRGLVAAIALPELMAQMGESSPILLMPAEADAGEATLLRGFRLSVAMSPDAAPD